MGGQRRVAKHVVEAFYENMSEDSKDGDVMDCTKASWALALDHTTCAVQKKVPLEQRMAFIHIGVVLAVLLSFCTISRVLHISTFPFVSIVL